MRFSDLRSCGLEPLDREARRLELRLEHLPFRLDGLHVLLRFPERRERRVTHRSSLGDLRDLLLELLNCSFSPPRLLSRSVPLLLGRVRARSGRGDGRIGGGGGIGRAPRDVIRAAAHQRLGLRRAPLDVAQLTERLLLLCRRQRKLEGHRGQLDAPRLALVGALLELLGVRAANLVKLRHRHLRLPPHRLL